MLKVLLSPPFVNKTKALLEISIGEGTGIWNARVDDVWGNPLLQDVQVALFHKNQIYWALCDKNSVWKR